MLATNPHSLISALQCASSLEGTYIVQVEEAVDISQPISERYKSTYNPNRTLMVNLFDGEPACALGERLSL